MAGKATGERIDGARKRRVIELVSNGATINKTSKAVKLGWQTVAAIVELESETIAKRKTMLSDKFATIAMLGAERLKAEVLTLPPGSLIPAVGMACDKVLALTQDPQSQLNNHLHLHLDSVNQIEQFNQMCKRLESNPIQPVQDREVLTDGHRDASTKEKQIKAKEIQAENHSDSSPT